MLFFKKRASFNLLESKFYIISFVILVLFSFNVLLNKKEYQNKNSLLLMEELRNQAHLENARQYDQIILSISRKLSPASVLSQDDNSNFADIIYIGGIFSASKPYPNPYKLLNYSKNNPFLDGIIQLDFSKIVTIFLFLMIIFLAYDVINGERENGTLQLCLSNSFKRYKILVGEYLGIIFTITIPFLLSIIILILILLFPPSISFDIELILRITLIIFVTLLFVSGCVLLCIWISSLTRFSSTSLALLLLIYVIFVFVYPNFIYLIKKPNMENSLSYSNEITIPQEAIYLLRSKNSKNNVHDYLKIFNPVTSYNDVIKSLTHSDSLCYIHFLQKAEYFNTLLSEWQRNKIEKYPSRDKGYNLNWGLLDLEDIPFIQYKPPSISESFISILPGFINLLFFNVFCLFGSLISLIRYIPV